MTLKRKADKINGTTVGYMLITEDGACVFYINHDDERSAGMQWNLCEGDSPIKGFLDSFKTLKAATEAANKEFESDQ